MKIYIFLTMLILTSCSSSSTEFIVEKESPIVQGKILSENVGIETLGGVLTPLLKSGCALPCELSQIFSTAEDNQDQITINLIRGSSKLANDGTSLGKYKLMGIAPAPRGEPKIKVIFGASDGRIWLSASDVDKISKIQIIKVE